MFTVENIEYLNHMISREGVATNPTKLSTIAGWPLPTSVKQLHGFLDLAGYKFLKIGLDIEPDKTLVQRFNGLTGLIGV